MHFGHLRTALEVRENLAMDEIRLIPCHVPPHRAQPGATANQRLTMLQLAADSEPMFTVDSREIERSGPSYTVDTLHSLRNDLGKMPLCLIVGADAFLGMMSWHRWRDLLNLAHIVVMHRPGFTPLPGGELARVTASRRISDGSLLKQKAAGNIFFQKVTQLDISASAIRNLIRQGKSPRFLLPDAVWRQICEKRLYGLVH